MADAYQCDNCGDFSAERDHRYYLKANREANCYNALDIELCPDCYKKLYEFITEDL
jgi:hypothetical protein